MTVGMVRCSRREDRTHRLSGAKGSRDILHAALKGPLTAEVPASWLRLDAERVDFVIAYEAAAEKCTESHTGERLRIRSSAPPVLPARGDGSRIDAHHDAAHIFTRSGLL